MTRKIDSEKTSQEPSFSGAVKGSTSAHQSLVETILVALSAIPGVRVWKQTTGAGHVMQGNSTKFIQFGLVGSADISGIICSEIPVWPGLGSASPEYRTVGLRLEVECKTGNAVQSDAQKKFQAMIERHGGVYILARNVDEVILKVKSHL